MSRNGWGKLGDKTIAYVLGDSINDTYQSVKVKKVAPDAPAPVWEIDGPERHVPGGADNVAEQLLYLSAHVTLAHLSTHGGNLSTVRGTGEQVFTGSGRLRVLSRAGVDNQKTRFVCAGHILSRLDRFKAADHRGRLMAVNGILDEIEGDLRRREIKDGCDPDGRKAVAILSDYAAGFWSSSLAIRAVAIFAAYGVPVLVDPKPPRMVNGERMGAFLSDWTGATVVKLNESEARDFSGLPGDYATESHVAKCRELTQAVTVATRGSKPPLVCGGMFPPHTVFFGRDYSTDRPLWSSGAGDCFAAFLAERLAHEKKVTAEALAHAHSAGAVYTTKSFNAPVHPREAMERAGYSRAKIYTAPLELASRISALPSGSKIGYTNGVFDLLHAGHVSGLAWARKRCDFLVVFVNSDSSVYSNRGVNPVAWFDQRIACLAALSSVDAVIGFNETKPTSTFAAVGRCDVLFKGEEYIGKHVEGSGLAESVEYIPTEFDVHSSYLRNRAAVLDGEAKLVKRKED